MESKKRNKKVREKTKVMKMKENERDENRIMYR